MAPAAHDEAVPAVILRTRPLGESDLVVVLLTPMHGKVDAAARNARKSRRRFAGGLSPGMRGRASLAQSRRSASSLLRLNGFEVTAMHGEVGRDLTRFAFVAYVCELTDEFVLGRQPDPRLFAELCVTLEAIVTPGPAPDAVLLRRFELALLRELGLLPAFRQCAACGVEVLRQAGAAADELAFDARLGGVLCEQHGARAPRTAAAVLAAAAGLSAGDEPPRKHMARVALQPAPFRRALRDITFGVVRQHLRRPLRSLALFRQLALGDSRGGT